MTQTNPEGPNDVLLALLAEIRRGDAWSERAIEQRLRRRFSPLEVRHALAVGVQRRQLTPSGTTARQRTYRIKRG
jgi:hypothetical protein